MATKQKISPEDATILKTYGTSPATKRFARDLMLEGKTLEEVIKTCQKRTRNQKHLVSCNAAGNERPAFRRYDIRTSKTA